MEIVMRSTPFRPAALILITLATPLLSLTACASDAMLAELQQDEHSYEVSRDSLYAARSAGDATAIAANAKLYKVAVMKLRLDRGIYSTPNDHEKQEKQGRT